MKSNMKMHNDLSPSKRWVAYFEKMELPTPQPATDAAIMWQIEWNHLIESEADGYIPYSHVGVLQECLELPVKVAQLVDSVADYFTKGTIVKGNVQMHVAEVYLNMAHIVANLKTQKDADHFLLSQLVDAPAEYWMEQTAEKPASISTNPDNGVKLSTVTTWVAAIGYINLAIQDEDPAALVRSLRIAYQKLLDICELIDCKIFECFDEFFDVL